MKNPPQNEKEFNEFMEKIDDFLRKERVPISARQIKGLMEVAKRLNVDVYFVGEEHLIPGDYTELSLSSHVKRWFNNRYGLKLNVDFNLAKVVVLVNNDPYKMILPEILGGGEVKFICDRNLVEYPNVPIKDPKDNK